MYGRELSPVKKIQKARAHLLFDQPFFGTLALQLKMVESESQLCSKTKQPNLMVDGETVWFHPDFARENSLSVCKSALAHEILHLACLHHTRINGRKHSIWNQACDYVVNDILKQSGFEVPADWLYNSAYSGKSADEVYKLIPIPPEGNKGGNGQGQGQGQNQNQNQGQGQGQNQNQNQGQGQVQGQGQNQGKNKDQQGKGQGQGQGQSQGQGQGQGQNQNQDKGQGQGSYSPGDFKQPPSTSGPDQAPSQNDLKQNEEKWKIAIAQAAQSSKMQGNMPGHLNRFVKDLLKPKVDWQAALQGFVERVVYDDYAWSRPNKRYVPSGIYLPGLYNEDIGKMVCVIDTSGSISQRVLSQFASEISAIMDLFDPKLMTVYYVDTQINGKPQEFTKDDTPLDLKLRGGGGTRFDPAFNAIEESGEDPVCLIYLTDMCCSRYPDFTPNYPVLWVNTRTRLHYGPPPFGEVLYMNGQDDD